MNAPAITPSRVLFLAPEFLTWLYFAVIDHDGVVVDFDEVARAASGGKAEEMEIAIGGKLKLAGDAGPTATLAGAGLSDNGEVLQAVRRGAFVDSLAFDFSIGHRTYSVTLLQDGTRTVKLPDVFTDPAEDEHVDAAGAPIDPLAKPAKKARPKLPIEDVIDLRVLMLDEVDSVLSALFAAFMRRRVDAAEWENDVRAIRQAVVDGLARRNEAPGG